MSLEHSRALRLGEGVTGRPASELERELENSLVTVGLDPELPGSRLAARVLLTTLRRLPGRLALNRDGLPATLVEDLVRSAEEVDPQRSIAVVDGFPAEKNVAIRIAAVAPRGVIRVTPDGYGMHLVNDSSASMQIARPANALGAVYAAALGAGEAFKRTAHVLPKRRSLPRYLRYCPVSLSTNLRRVPDLPDILGLDLALVGLGAVGSGTALILSELGAEGVILLVDPQTYAPENRGTYSLGGDREAREGPLKVDLAARVLCRFETIPFPQSVENVVRQVDEGKLPWPQVVLSGLDSVEARHETQRLWPDHLIDAATGDTALGLHYVRGSGSPCMMCFLPARRDGPTSAERLATATGLPVERAARGDEILVEQDLVGLTDEQRCRLLPYLSKPVCGLAQALGLTALGAGGFRPAVPFVSLQAACLAVGRLLSVALGDGERPNFVQYDALIGPKSSTIERRLAAPGCYCQTRSDTIRRVRDTRRRSS